MYSQKIEETAARMNITDPEYTLYVSIKKQRLYLFKNTKTVSDYAISTSSNKPSCIENSYGTPVGLHHIVDKIGASEPQGMIFKGRKAIAKCYQDLSDDEQSERLITSRILRLAGLEPGLNQGPGCDSYDRYIYIHGTNHEDKIGEAQSMGCIELSNNDILDLFNKAATGSLVLIEL